MIINSIHWTIKERGIDKSETDCQSVRLDAFENDNSFDF